VLHVARWKCRTQKNRQKFAIWAPSLTQQRHVSTSRKKNLLSSNISSTCSHNMANVGPLTA